MRKATFEKYDAAINDCIERGLTFKKVDDFCSIYGIGRSATTPMVKMGFIKKNKMGLYYFDEQINKDVIKEIVKYQKWMQSKRKLDSKEIERKNNYAEKHLDLTKPRKIERTQESHNQTTDEWSIFWGLIKFKRQRAQVKE
jgi:hypothetical protein